MDTIEIEAAAAAVIGARHLRCSRNGQDAAVAWTHSDEMPRDGISPTSVVNRTRAGIVVVCDGCSSGASSEVGARLGAALFARLISAQIRAGRRVTCPETWALVRAHAVHALAELLEQMPGDRERVIHDYFLFTVIAAAIAPDGAAVWALGDGAYSMGEVTRVLGPFADNAPPYLAYDLLGEAHPARFEVTAERCGALVIATDGALDLGGDLAQFTVPKFIDHPDALRRYLTVLARSHERIDWEERRVVRTPAALQDDCAIGVLRWSVS